MELDQQQTSNIRNKRWSVIHFQCPGLGHKLQVLKFLLKNLSETAAFKQDLSCAEALVHTLLATVRELTCCFAIMLMNISILKPTQQRYVTTKSGIICLEKSLRKGFTGYSSIFWQTFYLTVLSLPTRNNQRTLTAARQHDLHRMYKELSLNCIIVVILKVTISHVITTELFWC